MADRIWNREGGPFRVYQNYLDDSHPKPAFESDLPKQKDDYPKLN